MRGRIQRQHKVRWISLIEIVDLVKKYRDTEVLSDINLNLPETGLVTFKGKNGSGKSTLLNIIGGIDVPTKGIVRVDGVDICSLSEKERSTYRERYVSFILQSDNLFEEMTARENIEITGATSNVEKIANVLGIKDKLDVKVKVLSGGEKQRVALARAIVNNSKIILADEPTAQIDVETKKLIYDILKQESKRRLVILVVHDELPLDDDIAMRIVHLENGKIKTINLSKRSLARNEISLHRNTFRPLNFAKKNHFKNKKGIVRTCEFLIFSILTILLLSSLANFDKDKSIIKTMIKEGDGTIAFYKKDGIHDFNRDDLDFLDENNKSSSKLMAWRSISKDGEWLAFAIGEASLGKYFADGNTKLTFYDYREMDNLEYGREPVLKNEIVINSFLAHCFVLYGVKDSEGNIYFPKDEHSLVDDDIEIDLGGVSIKIVGIKKVDDSVFRKGEYSKALKSIYEARLETIYSNVYVTDEFYELYENISSLKEDYRFAIEGMSQRSFEVYPFRDRVNLKRDIIIENLENTDMIINYDLLYSLCRGDEDECLEKEVRFVVSGRDSKESIGPFRVVGISTDDKVYLNSDILRPYERNGISIELVKLEEKDEKVLKKLFSKYGKDNEKYGIVSNFSTAYGMIEDGVKLYVLVAGVLGTIVSIITIIFLVDFVQSSVDGHKKEVGLLKIIGIKNREITATFLWEVITINLISMIYAGILFLTFRIITNVLVSKYFFFRIDMLPISFTSIFIIAFVVIVTCTIALVVSTSKIKKLTPKEIINDYSF